MCDKITAAQIYIGQNSVDMCILGTEALHMHLTYMVRFSVKRVGVRMEARLYM